MDLEKRISAFSQLGKILGEFSMDASARTKHGSHSCSTDAILYESAIMASQSNGWFTKENLQFAIRALGYMLLEEKIRKWIKKYPKALSRKPEARKVGVIMAGNIPLAGFHDFICVLLSGNVFVGKLSSDDKFLLPAVAKILIGIEPRFKEQIIFTSPLNKIALFRAGANAADAIIATGSNNSAKHFEYYFRDIPKMVRKHRNSIAILDGAETEDELSNLGKDIFMHFGLGCRSVSKIFIPQNYDTDNFFSAIIDFGDIIHHNKYFNNYTYYRCVYILNKEKFLDNNFLMLKEDERIASPVATLYYERYKNKEELFQKLEEQKENIQCVVAGPDFKSLIPNPQSLIRHGQTQSPALWDCADGVDTMKFLLSLTD